MTNLVTEALGRRVAIRKANDTAFQHPSVRREVLKMMRLEKASSSVMTKAQANAGALLARIQRLLDDGSETSLLTLASIQATLADLAGVER